MSPIKKRVRGNIATKLAAYTLKTEACWLWGGHKTAAGYGVMSISGRHQYAHRIAYEQTFGQIPDGMLIDHRCFNRDCVNPGHLQPVTNKQNMENRPSAQRNSTTGVRGVFRSPSGKRWVAQIKHNKRSMHIGTFDTVEEAEAAVIAKRNELFTNNLLDRKLA